MSDILERIEAKVDSLREEVVGIKVVQAEQAKDLSHHIRRTDLLEDEQRSFREDLKPLTTGHAVWGVVGKGIVFMGVVAGIAEAVWKIAT